MSVESLEIAKTEYAAGKDAFERGQYRQSVQALEKASALIPPHTRLGGEVQMWLVTAYEAAGQRQEAISLCQSLARHPHYQTRQQSRRLLYILEAPRLQTRPEWLSEIPDLARLEDGNSPLRQKAAAAAPKRSPKEPEKPKFQMVEPGAANVPDNHFIWVMLLVVAGVIGSLVWLS